MKANEALLQQLIENGLTDIFSNSGSSEEGSIEAIGNNKTINYVMAMGPSSSMSLYTEHLKNKINGNELKVVCSRIARICKA